jgi:heptosyltransferase-2
MKILIIRFSSIGDIVLTTPVIRCLKNQTAAEIHVITKSSMKGLFENNPFVTKIHLLEDAFQQTILTLKKENFDYIIDLHNNLRSYRIKWALGVASSSVDKLNVKKWLAVQLKWKVLPDLHIVDRYLKTVAFLNVQNDHQGLDYFIPENDKILIEENFSLRPYQYVCISLGAQHKTKVLPFNKMQELISKINEPIILLGGKEDETIGQQLEELYSSSKTIINAAGKLTLNQSASVIQQCKYIYSHDTGLMHIASALKKRIVSIWGNTIPSFGMGPYLTEHEIWEVEHLTCRPCSKIGFSSCPKKHFNCMQQQTLDVEEIENKWK